jgi:hypothetical protein
MQYSNSPRLGSAQSDGATRRDRTGDLLITKFRVSVYVADSAFGVSRCTLAISVWSARIEPDFEPIFES